MGAIMLGFMVILMQNILTHRHRIGIIQLRIIMNRMKLGL